MKLVTRTFTDSIISAAEVVVENGEVITKDLEPLKVTGKIDNTKALKEVRKMYGKDNQYAILDIAYEDVTYGMDVEEFKLNATELN